MNRTYTIKDIAACVGVSTSTVSRVLSNAPSAKVVTESTRRKIFDAVEEFGYVPNVNARRLVQNKTNLIGVVVPADEGCNRVHSVMRNRGFTETLSGIESTLKPHNYRIVLIFNDARFRQQQEALHLFKSNSLDGMIIWGPRLDETCWEELSSYNVVQVSNYSSLTSSIPYVGHDNIQAAYDITTKLIQKGHRRILYLDSNEKISIFEERRQGYESALKNAGIPFNHELYIVPNTNGPLSSIEEIINAKAGKFDAVQCPNDGTALRCGQLLKSRGIRIPEDVIITGGDRVEDEYGDLIDWKIPLISFKLKCFETGELATQILLQMIAGGKNISRRTLLQVEQVETV